MQKYCGVFTYRVEKPMTDHVEFHSRMEMHDSLPIITVQDFNFRIDTEGQRPQITQRWAGFAFVSNQGFISRFMINYVNPKIRMIENIYAPHEFINSGDQSKIYTRILISSSEDGSGGIAESRYAVGVRSKKYFKLNISSRIFERESMISIIKSNVSVMEMSERYISGLQWDIPL